MSTGAWVMFLVGITVLFGGLAVCIGIALKAGQSGSRESPGEGDG